MTKNIPSARQPRAWRPLCAVGLVGAVILAGCGTDDNGQVGPSQADGTCPTGTVTGAGSSFQAPMEQQWSATYLARCPGVRVNYASVGSGAGIQQFGQGTVDFAGSDVTMTGEEQRAANSRCGGSPAVHLPVTAGGVAVTYHLTGVHALRLSPGTLADIFDGAIRRWNDPRVAADNPGTALPDHPIVVFHRADGSGTTAVFSAYLAAAAPGRWPLGSGKTLDWPVGQGAKGNEGVSAGVQQTVGAITYTEQAFAEQQGLPTALIGNAGNHYVALTAAHVSSALRGARVTGHGRDLSMTLNYRPTGAEDYPIATVSYVIVCAGYPPGVSADTVRALRDYLGYAVGDGQRVAERMGFAPLPPDLATTVADVLRSVSAS